MLKVNLTWNEKMKFTGTDVDGRTVVMDAAEVYGGEGKGIRPMELLLMSLAGCTAIEVGNVMNKMRLGYTRFDIEVEAEKAETVPHVFTEIRVHYILEGEGISLKNSSKPLKSAG